MTWRNSGSHDSGKERNIMGIFGFTRERPTKEVTRDQVDITRDDPGRTTTTKYSNITVTLTPAGKEKAEQFSLVGPEYEIIATLLEEGTMAVGELASKTGFSVNKTRDICRVLGPPPKGKGYIKVVKV